MNQSIARLTKQCITIAVVLFLLGGNVWAYTFNDATLVQEYKYSSSTSSAWVDVVGDTRIFDTFGADLVGDLLTIYTNWYPGKGSSLNVSTAYFFIDDGIDGDFDYAVKLTGTGNNVYLNPAYSTSYDLMRNGGYRYGGKYDDAYVSPSFIPVKATNTATEQADVEWSGSTGSLYNHVAIDLSGLNLSNDWYFVWGTATCGNDTFSGQYHAQVPEPASLLLVGLGLIGVAGMRRRLGR